MKPATATTLDAHTIVLDGTVDVDEAAELLLGARRRVDAADGAYLLRLVQPVTAVDPLEWAVAHPSAPDRVYWEPRDESVSSAGLGSAFTETRDSLGAGAELPGFVRERGNPAAPALRYLVTGSFSEPWPEFGRTRIHLPAWELRHTGREHVLIYQEIVDPSAPPPDSPPVWMPTTTVTGDGLAHDLDPVNGRDAYEQWIAAVESVLVDVASGDAEKVVLARQLAYDAPENLDPFLLMRRLRDVHRSTFRFVIQVSDRCAFLGASPELLYRRRDRFIESEAVAGTRPRGSSVTSDRRLAEELLTSDKEHREHQLVVEHVASSLVSLCHTFAAAPTPSVQRLTNVQHLRTSFRGTLSDGVSDLDILDALHPTPATCGWPLAAAHERIAALEPFARGLYAGPISWMGPDATECAVALRCGRVDDNRLTLYAGAGLVAGSDPHAEWDETENKLNAFRCVVNPRHD
jgi:menaquinone-specific isochorismate synthase